MTDWTEDDLAAGTAGEHLVCADLLGVCVRCGVDSNQASGDLDRDRGPTPQGKRFVDYPFARAIDR